jgi:hypothetical protein
LERYCPKVKAVDFWRNIAGTAHCQHGISFGLGISRRQQQPVAQALTREHSLASLANGGGVTVGGVAAVCAVHGGGIVMNHDKTNMLPHLKTSITKVSTATTGATSQASAAKRTIKAAVTTVNTVNTSKTAAQDQKPATTTINNNFNTTATAQHEPTKVKSCKIQPTIIPMRPNKLERSCWRFRARWIPL